MSETWLTMTASDLGRGIESGEINPVELTETYLTAAKEHEHSDKIYARFTQTRAMAEAKAAADRVRSGTRRSLLDGVPISWKDNFDTAEVLTEAGSAFLKGRVPDRDAHVLEQATASGLVCLGKTHMSELAFSGLGVNPITATPPNVHNAELAPGGSSSGAGTSVAFGLAAAGIGSDTGGSVRVPSVWNDLVGFKTTHGALSLEGVVPLCASFDTVGPLCRSVEDAAHLIAAMTNKRAVDLSNASLDGRRFLVCESVALDGCEPEVLEVLTQSVERLVDAGAKVEMHGVPMVTPALELAGVLFGAEAYATWQDDIEGQPDQMFTRILERFRSGKDYKASAYVAAWQELEKIKRSFAQATAAYDAVLMPSSPIRPPNTKKLLDDESFYNKTNLIALRNTRIGNLLGLCAVTLPSEVPSIGLMAMGKAGGDRELLRLASAMEPALRG